MQHVKLSSSALVAFTSIGEIVISGSTGVNITFMYNRESWCISALTVNCKVGPFRPS